MSKGGKWRSEKDAGEDPLMEARGRRKGRVER